MVSEATSHKGACHCGAVRFTVALPAEPRGARCDCSICSMKGAVTVGAPVTALEVVEGADKLTCYRFNTGVAEHWFCSICGSYTFHQRRSDPAMYGVNVACLGLHPLHDFPDVPVLDGMNHSLDNGGKMHLAGRLRFEQGEG